MPRTKNQNSKVELNEVQEKMLEGIRQQMNNADTKDFEIMIQKLTEDKKTASEKERNDVINKIKENCKTFGITATELRGALDVRRRGRKSEINYIRKKINELNIKAGELGYRGDYRNIDKDELTD